ncbi:Uncharacterized protein PECH_007116 [Penicillium ucsense]|uniref:Uncharacterized protein n=1 Tax=Penicillium ucsense TaxID=2839758 RepID=A0A8J8WIV5_9EURO|nr:Uncharacterized protein PECM_006873 [Penicillium ucsense]KAF7735138.1 Uncharacterized protein PECH_007116 [Penicillium ucsense]
MSTTSTLTTTSTSTHTSAAATCTGNVYVLPNVTDAACGAPVSGNITDAFDSCCKGNTPTKYDNDCGIYCLAIGQDIGELTKCLEQKSGSYSVFCNKGTNVTATASATTTKTSSTGTSTHSGAASTSSGAAVVNQSVSKMGLGVLAMMFCSALMGVVA